MEHNVPKTTPSPYMQLYIFFHTLLPFQLNYLRDNAIYQTLGPFPYSTYIFSRHYTLLFIIDQ